jgi:hypothetical protein
VIILKYSNTILEYEEIKLERKEIKEIKPKGISTTGISFFIYKNV